MQEAEIHAYARQLFEARGPKAAAEAAQKAQAFEEKGDQDQSRTWRHIEDAIKLMRGPHQP
ncbi:hypothetical protein [Rhodoblastus acidophilus]|uniref:hypothetical protein n=1 Tax=Rhodoblastus acidophilus TaxID=1074 RepID=UPI001608421C|nr:hypothetical protein [Rhodoblastus acidophilus]